MTMSICRSRSGVRLAALSLMLAAPCARAQREPATIPTSLATAIFSGLGAQTGMTARFTVGRPPAGWPRALLPGAPWKVVGGVEFGPLQATLMEGPRSRDLVAEYTALVTRAGYHEAFFGEESRGGFVAGPLPRSYCSGSGIVTLVPRDSTTTTRALLVQYMSGEPVQGCADARIDGQHAPLVVPPLHAPEGVQPMGRSSGWSFNSVEQTVQLTGSLTANEILAHYTRQLVAGGWTAAGQPIVSGGVGLQPLSARDKDGTQWEGMMIIITTDDQRNLTLRMAKPTTASRSP